MGVSARFESLSIEAGKVGKQSIALQEDDVEEWTNAWRSGTPSVESRASHLGGEWTLPDGTRVPAYSGPGVGTFIADFKRADLLDYSE